MSPDEIFSWIVRGMVGGMMAFLWFKVNNSVTKDEMKEYVGLRITPMKESVDKNTEAVVAMTEAFHKIDKKLDRIEMEIDNGKSDHGGHS